MVEYVGLDVSKQETRFCVKDRSTGKKRPLNVCVFSNVNGAVHLLGLSICTDFAVTINFCRYCQRTCLAPHLI